MQTWQTDSQSVLNSLSDDRFCMKLWVTGNNLCVRVVLLFIFKTLSLLNLRVVLNLPIWCYPGRDKFVLLTMLAFNICTALIKEQMLKQCMARWSKTHHMTPVGKNRRGCRLYLPLSSSKTAAKSQTLFSFVSCREADEWFQENVQPPPPPPPPPKISVMRRPTC